MKAKNIIFGVIGVGVLVGGYFAVRSLIQDNEHTPKDKDKEGDKGESQGSGKATSGETTSGSKKQAKGTSFPLNIGSWGRKIVMLQYALNNKYGHKVDVDGKFGNQTKEALNSDSPLEWCKYNPFGSCQVSEADYNEIIKDVDFSNVQGELSQWDSADGEVWTKGAEASQPYAMAGGDYPSASDGSWASADSGWAMEYMTKVVPDDFWEGVDGGLASRYAFWGQGNPQENYANAKGSSGIKRGNECPCATTGSNTECCHGYCVMQGSCQVGGVQSKNGKKIKLR